MQVDSDVCVGVYEIEGQRQRDDSFEKDEAVLLTHS